MHGCERMQRFPSALLCHPPDTDRLQVGHRSLATYRELCALATDMGQPDMLYKFMDLANHAAAATSSRGAAFGCALASGWVLHRQDRGREHTAVHESFQVIEAPAVRLEHGGQHHLACLAASQTMHCLVL